MQLAATLNRTSDKGPDFCASSPPQNANPSACPTLTPPRACGPPPPNLLYTRKLDSQARVLGRGRALLRHALLLLLLLRGVLT